jgi:hypothetical protein
MIDLFLLCPGPQVRKLTYTSKKIGGQLPDILIASISIFCQMAVALKKHSPFDFFCQGK